MGSPASVTMTAKTSHHQHQGLQEVTWCVSIALASTSLRAPRPSFKLILDLVVLPPSPRAHHSRRHHQLAQMLFMAKLIIHRHVRIAFFRFPLSNFG